MNTHCVVYATHIRECTVLFMKLWDQDAYVQTFTTHDVMLASKVTNIVSYIQRKHAVRRF